MIKLPKVIRSFWYCILGVYDSDTDDLVMIWLLGTARIPRSKLVNVDLPSVRKTVLLLLLSACFLIV